MVPILSQFIRDKYFYSHEEIYEVAQSNIVSRYKNQSDLEKVALQILKTYGNFKIPFQYLETIREYQQKHRRYWSIRINFEKDKNGKKWPVHFDFYISARSSAGQSNGLLNRRS